MTESASSMTGSPCHKRSVQPLCTQARSQMSGAICTTSRSEVSAVMLNLPEWNISPGEDQLPQVQVVGAAAEGISHTAAATGRISS